MKAIQINYYNKEMPPVLHGDVEASPDPLSPRFRRLRCRCCGASWRESINAIAQVLDDNVAANVGDYYPGYVDCKTYYEDQIK